MNMNVYDQLQALNITLPALAVPAAAYVPYVQSGNLVFLSGHLPALALRSGLGQADHHTLQQHILALHLGGQSALGKMRRAPAGAGKAQQD